VVDRRKMADPKYANLPGIDHDAPDSYETNDLPESDQPLDDPEEGNECVEKIPFNSNEAFSKFKGKSLDATNLDFSDRVSSSRRTGYDANQTVYEMAGEPRQQETPQQRYQRLQHEMRELVEDVNKIKENVSSDGSMESPVNLTRQVEYLQQQLSDLQLDQMLGPGTGQLNLADPQAALHKRLLTELDSYTPPAAADGKAGKVADAGNTSSVTYQLYYRPEQAKFSSNARMAELEQRLERIEAVIGTQPEKLSTLTAETNNKSVVGAITVLAGKLKLLEPGQLEQVEGRMYALTQKLNTISEKKESIEDLEKNTKVCELYDMVKKWDAVVDTLPHVVDRLTALKELHEQALQFSQALTHLDTAQQQLTFHLQTHGDMTKQMEKTLSENMAMVKTNSSSLDERMKALK